MKKLFYLLLLFLSVFNCVAQVTKDTWCTTIPPTQSQKGVFLQKFQSLESQRNARKTAETVTNIALKIHLVTKSDGKTEVSDGDIKELMDTLNRHFIKANIQFYVCGGVDYINDDASYTFDTQNENIFCKVHDVNNAVNVYLVKEFTNAGLGGYTYFPSSNKNTNRIFCAYKSRSDLITKILPHEMGHYFGLLHTFQDSQYQPVSEAVSRDEKSNCAYRGDLLCDTPADPYGKADFRIQNCQFISGNVDVNGDRFNPQLGNLMSYYRGCGNFFTPGQIGMIKTGLFIRQIQDPSRELAYSIDCDGISSNMILTKDLYLDGKKTLDYPTPEICVEKPFTITFAAQGDFKPDNEYKAYLIAENYTHSVEIGNGKGNEIVCKIPQGTPNNSSIYRVQVISTNPVIHSTISLFRMFVNTPASIELSGSYNIFENESVDVPIKASGGTIYLDFSNNEKAHYATIALPTLTFAQKKSEVITVKRIYNSCGEGISKGQIELNVVPKPVATNFVVENLTGKYLCQGALMKLNLKSDGVFGEANTFKIQISDSKGDNFQDIAIHTNAKRVLEIKIPENLPEGNAYKIKIFSTYPAIEYISQNLIAQPVSAKLSGDVAIANGEKANLRIQLTGKPPFTLISSEGDSIITQQNEYQWAVSPTETRAYSLKSINDAACGNGQVQGNALVKVNYPLKTSVLNFPFICAGTPVKVPFQLLEGVSIDDGFLVQLSDNSGKDFRNISGSGNSSPLDAIIPVDIPEGNNYRIRVISKNGQYIGSESNEFEIRQKPTALLEGVIKGIKGSSANLPIKLTGGGPWNVEMNTGTQTLKHTIPQSPAKLPVNIESNNTYKLNSISNACGVGKVFGQAIVTLTERADDYCIPVNNSKNVIDGKITRVRISDLNENMLLNSYDVKMGKDNYTDNTAIITYLKPGNSYNYHIVTSDVASETFHYSLSWQYLILWIDFDQNGRFDKNEIIVDNALEYAKSTFKVPEGAKRGLTRMRVRSYTDNYQHITEDPCLSVYIGETEDYSLFITDDTPAYSAIIQMKESALCKAKEYEFPFTASGAFSEANTFKVGLYNSLGNFLGYIGESKASPVKIKFPKDIPIGSNYTMRLIATEPNFEGNFTTAFRINDFPTVTLSGDQKAYLGQLMPLTIVLDGGGDWVYSILYGGGGTGNYIQNKIITDYPGEFASITSKPGIYEFKATDVINSACGAGKASGSARVEVLEPDPSIPAILGLTTSFYQRFYNCIQSDTRSINFTTQGAFGKDNYFTCYLIDSNDKFVAILGYSKSSMMFITVPENINGYGYKLKITSSEPYAESPLSSSFTIFPTPTAKISGYSEILPGEYGAIQLDLTGMEHWALGLSDGTSIVTNLASQTLKVSPAKTQTYTISSLESNFCEGNISGSATVKVLESRATSLSFKQPASVCVGSSVMLVFYTDGTFRKKNTFKLSLLKKNGYKISDIEALVVNDSTLNFIVPDDVPPGEDYQLKLITISPYMESDISQPFKLKPVSTATISSEVKSVYEKSTIRLRIDFTGEAPYNFELSDGRLYTNITQSPYFIDTKSILGINKYTIKRLGNSCGQGKTIGSADLNVMPLPVIITQPLLVNTVCTGNKIFIPFKITNGEFQPDNVFKVDLYDYTNRNSRILQTTMQGDSLFAVIPEDINSGVYTIRVNGTNPSIIGSLAASELTIRTYPKGNITGKSSVIQGDSARLQLTLSGNAPWTIKLSNGTELKDITNGNFLVNYVPQKSETLTITSVRNACGEGSVEGQASIVVHYLEEIENLVKIYPIPFQQETKLYIDEALMKKPAAYTITDVLGRVIVVKKEFSSSQTSIDLNFHPPGIYYVRITTNKKEFFRKIAK